MKFGPIRSIVIDDKPTHLLAIAAGLAAVGIPCMSYWYNRKNGNLTPKPKELNKHLRLIFSDLNLSESGPNPEPEDLESVIESVLRQLLAADAGPYVLVFWTEVTGKAAKVRELLYERLKDVPLPLAVVELKKADFLPKKLSKPVDLEQGLQKVFGDLSRKLNALGKEVALLSEVSAELNIVAEWESRATEAAAGTINEMVSQARKDAADETKVGETLKNLLAFVGISAAGTAPAAAEPARALDLGMSEILIDRFATSVDEKAYRRLVSNTLGPLIAAAPAFKDRHRIAAALNTFFHIDVNVKDTKSNERGVVIPIGKHLTEKKLGMSHTQLLQTEFLYSAKASAESQGLYAALPSDARAVLVEIGADCDHAQPKPRSIRYLVGFEVPKKYKDFLVRGGKTMFPPLHCLGPWLIDGSEMYLIVSTRRFITWQHSTQPAGKVQYRLRTLLVNKLLHDYSSWHSRPGIVEFRP